MTRTATSPTALEAPSDERSNVAELPTAAAPRPTTPASGGRKRLVLTTLAIMAIGFGLWRGWAWFSEGRFMISTDDAFVRADTATIAAKATGHILSVGVRDNEFVKTGDVLAEIDPGDYRLAVASARAKIATQTATIARIDAQAEAQKSVITQAEAQLASARSDVDRTIADFERAEALVKANYGTSQRLDQARADRDRTRASVAVAEAGVAAAKGTLGVYLAQKTEAEQTRAELETALDKAERDLEFTTVRAPFDGVVGNRAVQTGQLVQPGNRLLALVPLASAYVEANFKETQLAELRPGQKVTISIDAYGGREIHGTVDSVAPASGAQFSLLPPENATGNFTKIVQRVPVKILVSPEVAREGVLRPGLSVAVDVDTRTAAH